MITPILTTKLHIPSTSSTVIQRSRLLQRLNNGLEHKLILVSASAGFGKTTLIASWLETVKYPVGWLSLEETDSTAQRFLHYLIAALQTIEPSIGQQVLPLLQSSQQLSIETALTLLINDITSFEYKVIFVLDDYHSIDSTEIDAALTFFVDHLPINMTLVITTREDPQLPLAKYRARAVLTELRADDLRFTNTEMQVFLNQMMGLDLTIEAIAALESRTEGWIASLQMLALSLQRQPDKAQFIETFTGSHRYILDYLLEEVLYHQSEETQRFLLQTSILRRLNADLCDAVTQMNDSQRVLEQLERRNLFITPQDNIRHWYRYHHLFADLLHKRLEQSSHLDINSLHILASHWFEQHNLRHEAIYHALAAEDFDLAASLIELEWSTLHASTFRSSEQLKWMQALPSSVYQNRPVLSTGYAWALLNFGELEEADKRLSDAEHWLDNDSKSDTDTSEMVVIDEAEFQRLPATIAAARAYLSVAFGNISETIAYGQKALVHLTQRDHQWRGIVTSLLGLAYWTQGQLSAAYDAMSAGMTHMIELGNISFALSSTFGLADLRLGQGRLRDAIAVYKQSLQIAESQSYTVQGVADLYMGLGDLYREQNDLETAQEYFRKSESLGKDAGLPDWRVRFCKFQARMKLVESAFDEALALLDEAERLYYPTPVPNIRPIAAMRASVHIQQGDLQTAAIWAGQQDLSLDSAVNYLNEFDLMTLARLHIAQFKMTHTNPSTDALHHLLMRLLDAAESQQRMGSVIEILILQAQLKRLEGNNDGAFDSLERALRLAEPEGYVRLFIDEGDIIRELLSDIASHGIHPDYASTLLAAFEIPSTSQSASSQPLIDALSDRELEVLTLIADGLSNRNISERLFIALDTVKGHNRIIYQKLQVSRRTEAVARARELGII